MLDYGSVVNLIECRNGWTGATREDCKVLRAILGSSLVRDLEEGIGQLIRHGYRVGGVCQLTS